MSTVATDGKSMSGDGLSVGAYKCSDTIVKVFRWLDTIVGVVGASDQCVRFTSWYMRTREVQPDGSVFYERGANDNEYPVFDEQFEAMVLTEDGSCYKYYDQPEAIKVDVPHAMGAGCEIAMGAMKAGASPEKAIEIAIELNIHTGGKITTCRFEMNEFLDGFLDSCTGEED